MQRIIQVTMNKLHSPKEVDKFLEIYSCIKLNQEDIQNMSTPINNEIKSIIKKIIPNKQIQDKVPQVNSIKHCKEELNSILSSVQSLSHVRLFVTP